MGMCDCRILCGFDHCCSSEQFKVYQEMPEAQRPQFWNEVPCPQPHPPALVTLARRGDREAAAQVLQILRNEPGGSWAGVTQEEMIELEAGNEAAVKARRRWKAQIRLEHCRNPARYTRWTVDLSILLEPGSHLSTHKSFVSQEEAQQWANRFTGNRDVLAEYLKELNAEHPWSSCRYVMAEVTEVRKILLFREQEAYPWYWINGYRVWVLKAVEWYWESEAFKELIASGKASWKVTIDGKQVAPIPI